MSDYLERDLGSLSRAQRFGGGGPSSQVHVRLHFKKAIRMDYIIRNLYFNSSKYLVSLSEGILWGFLTLLGHIINVLLGRSKSLIPSDPGGGLVLKDEEDDDDEDDLNSPFSVIRTVNLFRSYAGPDRVMHPEDIAAFAHDLGKTPDNIGMMVLAYQMRVRTMGVFTEPEWVTGMSALRVDTLPKLMNVWTELESVKENWETFRDVFRFSYDYARESECKHLDVEVVKELLTIFLGHWSLLPKFLEYLSSGKVKALNKDQYFSIIEVQKIFENEKDLEEYDHEGAWPVLIDGFVSHVRSETETDHKNDARMDRR